MRGKTSDKLTLHFRHEADAQLCDPFARPLRNTPGWNGRWTLTKSRAAHGEKPDNGGTRLPTGEDLLRRYGVVSREMALREDFLLSWTLIAQNLQRL